MAIEVAHIAYHKIGENGGLVWKRISCFYRPLRLFVMQTC